MERPIGRVWVKDGYRATIGGNYCTQLPDYLDDLNAMREAEGVLTEQQQIDYAELLDSLTPEGVSVIYGDDHTWRGAFHIAHATPAQKAEAFLKALSKWQEPPTPSK